MPFNKREWVATGMTVSGNTTGSWAAVALSPMGFGECLERSLVKSGIATRSQAHEFRTEWERLERCNTTGEDADAHLRRFGQSVTWGNGRDCQTHDSA